MDNLEKSFFDKIKAAGDGLDEARIREAYEFAKEQHGEQKRESGDPYISHPLAVADILLSYSMDTDCIVAGILHDIIEDTPVTYTDIKRKFGQQAADLVNGVTKLGRIPYSSKEEEQMENLRKMFLAMVKDIRVIIIKFADRMHNLRTLQSLSDERRRRMALETMEVYAPLAHRLGMQQIKAELEDISIRYLDPIGYAEIEQNLARGKKQRESLLRHIVEKLRDGLESKGFKDLEIDGRLKQIYSIYWKMFYQNRSFEEIYDIYAIRILTDNITDCYHVLGEVHDLYKPVPGRFKDYISTPKPNGYQSLHTTVIGREGVPFEVQIRTHEMHSTAEFGIAAHWKYKTVASVDDKLDDKLIWMRHTLELQNGIKDTDDFMRTFKVDLLSDEVFVFTPKGDLINLPAGSTVIDFAYSIHSQVGNRMMGAKVNNKMVQLDYVVQNGDIIEIITGSSAHGPSRDWLGIVKTSEARTKIKTWFRKEKREENIEKGRAELDREIKREGMHLSEAQREEILAAVAARMGISGVDELYATLGYGGVAIGRIIPRIKKEYQKLKSPDMPEEAQALPDVVKQPSKIPPSGIVVEGIENCLVKLARCCKPLPGDNVIGYITKGFGVSVHRTDCTNVIHNMEIPEERGRFIKVHFAQEQRADLQSTLQITARDRFRSMADVTNTLVAMKVPIHAINARETSDGAERILLTVGVSNLEHLGSIMKKLGGISGIISVKRGAD